MPCKLHHFLLLLCFSCCSVSAQGLRIDIGHNDFRIRNLHFANYPERNVKVTYSTFESPRKYYNELTARKVPTIKKPRKHEFYAVLFFYNT